jgi:heat shock protein HtpX
MSDVPPAGSQPRPPGPWGLPHGAGPDASSSPDTPSAGGAGPAADATPPAADRPPRPLVRLQSTDFLAAQRHNRRVTTLLLLTLTAIAGVLGYVLGAWLEVETNELRWPSHVGLVCAAVLIGASLVWSGISMLWGDRMVLSMAGGKDIEKKDAPQLFNVVEELSIASGLPMPKIRIIETEVPNAFATALRTDRATIGITRGLLNQLNRDELQGVIAHEMSHVANLDSRYLVVVGVTVGLIALVSDMILRGLNWGGLSSNRSSRSRDKGGGAALILVILLIVVAILAPLAAKLVQFAVSRQREYLADATSVKLTRNPEGLIGALRKLAVLSKPFPGVSQATQHLFIVNPLREFTKSTPSLLATHPDIEDRIARLQNLR